LVDERGRLFLQDESKVKHILETRGNWSQSRIKKELWSAADEKMSSLNLEVMKNPRGSGPDEGNERNERNKRDL